MSLICGDVGIGTCALISVGEELSTGTNGGAAGKTLLLLDQLRDASV